MFAFVVFISVNFVSTGPRDWLGRTSLKCPVSCQMGRETLNRLDEEKMRLVDWCRWVLCVSDSTCTLSFG